LDEAAQKAAHQFYVSAHSPGGWLLCGLLALHIAGALRHQWMDGHAELPRMGVGRG
jgi:cytochrome b561